MLAERYSFVALTTTDLPRARRFWVEQIAFPVTAVTKEDEGRFFLVDAAGVAPRVASADGDVHRAGSTDAVIGFEVESLADTLADPAERDVYARRGPAEGPGGAHAELRDPDGRPVLVIGQA